MPWGGMETAARVKLRAIFKRWLWMSEIVCLVVSVQIESCRGQDTSFSSKRAAYSFSSSNSAATVAPSTCNGLPPQSIESVPPPGSPVVACSFDAVAPVAPSTVNTPPSLSSTSGFPLAPIASTMEASLPASDTSNLRGNLGIKYTPLTARPRGAAGGAHSSSLTGSLTDYRSALLLAGNIYFIIICILGCWYHCCDKKRKARRRALEASQPSLPSSTLSANDEEIGSTTTPAPNHYTNEPTGSTATPAPTRDKTELIDSAVMPSTSIPSTIELTHSVATPAPDT